MSLKLAVTPSTDARSPSWSITARLWTSVGAAFLALQIYVYGRWLANGQIGPRRAPAGIGTSTKVWAWTLQLLIIGMAVSVGIYLIHGCRRERRLTLDAMLALAWLSIEWQDSLVNYSRVAFYYNSYLLNLASWDSFIPGWSTHNAHLLPQPIAISGLGYLQSVPACILLTRTLKALASRRPGVRNATLFAIGLLLGGLMELTFELVCIRSGLYGYANVERSLSIWGGHTYQFPVYEAVLIGGLWSAVALLRYHVRADGRTRIEPPATAGRRSVSRTLAIVGYVNVVFLFYNVVTVAFTLHSDPQPHFPKDLQNGFCGAGTSVACADVGR